MIAFVRGTVSAVAPDAAVVDVGGVGLVVACAPATLARLRVGEVATVATSLVVREDSLTLYGFADDDEKAVFELVQTASGVGPRLAQAMLSELRPDDIRRAVATEDLATLTRVSGIGRKGAQRIVLELKDRLGTPGAAGSRPGSRQPTGWREQVHAALVGLGYTPRDADGALADLDADPEVDPSGVVPDVGALLRAALRHLARS